MAGVFHLASKMFVVITFSIYLALFVKHSTYVTSTAYSSPSVVLASRLADGSQYIIDDYREAYYWLRMNTPDDARVMSWWDYGYQIAGMADRTTLVDNNTWNNTHIAVDSIVIGTDYRLSAKQCPPEKKSHILSS
jgi:dolichyl-diphosphooligosaccharide---protein glycosyltransferase